MKNNKLQELFNSKKQNLLSIYLSAGYPKIDAMPKLAQVLEASGVDFIEAGMPYSDPLADGPTIQHSSAVALQNGMNLQLYFEQVAQIKQDTDLPVVFMGYFNQVLKSGIKNFLQKGLSAGIDGLIIPDLSPEIYQAKYQAVFEQAGIPLIFLISPTTSTTRIRLIDNLSKSFIYVVSDSATTGSQNGFNTETISYFEKIKSLHLNQPTVIGFGIDNAEKFDLACQYANGGIIGSAFIKALQQEDYLGATEEFVAKILGKK